MGLLAEDATNEPPPSSPTLFLGRWHLELVSDSWTRCLSESSLTTECRNVQLGGDGEVASLLLYQCLPCSLHWWRNPMALAQNALILDPRNQTQGLIKKPEFALIAWFP